MTRKDRVAYFYDSELLRRTNPVSGPDAVFVRMHD